MRTHPGTPDRRSGTEASSKGRPIQNLNRVDGKARRPDKIHGNSSDSGEGESRFANLGSAGLQRRQVRLPAFHRQVVIAVRYPSKKIAPQCVPGELLSRADLYLVPMILGLSQNGALDGASLEPQRLERWFGRAVQIDDPVHSLSHRPRSLIADQGAIVVVVEVNGPRDLGKPAKDFGVGVDDLYTVFVSRHDPWLALAPAVL